MLVKTKGVVLNFIRFRETSIIVKIYTEELGLQTYIVNGVRKKGGSGRIALFQPFTLLDMVVYTSNRGGITRISEYKCSYPFSSIPFDIRKSSILLFLSEVVSKSVREEEENPALFRFLYNSIQLFDRLEHGVENFHLVFLLQLTHYLGFGATSGADVTSQVALASTSLAATHLHGTQLQASEKYFDLLIHNPDDVQIPNGRLRRELLHILISYYQLHVDKLGEINSLTVLSEVLSE
ncbi:MAG: DNA repair protein RecO [Hymenobacteraceae bacterium]|nr:DNA repair protein RecO [Hymenobacteraceae bacterium]MDX5396875.1 DNA repair protein RecO [Hymenobacteraceae bacterium]MDX5442642.1 DNA repair protein RecO [Hymenobacteraceae bacterium]MDX5512946.1 DNA repair protein RecO [Hymenobacteraceae bacterium]